MLSSSAGGILLGASVAFAWPISRLWAARNFDLRFGLQERISMALEWAEKRDLARAAEEMRLKQNSDALAAARRVDVRARLPVRIVWQEILLALLLAGGAALVSYWGRPFFQAAQEKRLVQEAIAEEASRIEAILEEIHRASSLSQEQQDALAAPLEEARRRLEQAQTLEQSVSILTRAEGDIRSLQAAESQAQAQALRDAGQDWSQFQDSLLQQAGEQLKGGDARSAAQSLSELDLSQASPTEREALARQLEVASSTLAQAIPGLAERLNEAAAELRAGDTQAAEQELQDAARELSEAGGGMEGSTQASRAAAEVEAARERLLAQAGSGSQQGAGAGAAGSGDVRAGSTASQGTQEGHQPSSGGQDGAGGGAGRGEGAEDTATGGSTGASPIDQGNNPGDRGMQPYEPISPPGRLGEAGGQTLTLPPGESADNTVTGESDLPFDQPGSSQVPYMDVYAQYAKAYRQAIENGQVPASLRPVVRDYFSSLEPPAGP
jgi:hypothetical protein